MLQYQCNLCNRSFNVYKIYDHMLDKHNSYYDKWYDKCVEFVTSVVDLGTVSYLGDDGLPDNEKFANDTPNLPDWW